MTIKGINSFSSIGKVLIEGKRTTIGNTFLGKKKISFQEKRGNEKKSPKGFSDARRVVP